MSDGPRYIGRTGLIRRLRAVDGEPGTSLYTGGVATFHRADEVLEVVPPFGLAFEASYDQVRVGPLVNELERDRRVAVLLVRLGGYAVGVLEGERIMASKVGTRLVHARHRAGGSSANRFRRRRDNEVHALHEAAAAQAVRVLGPWLTQVEAAALGGDRDAVRLTIAESPALAVLERIALPRFFTVPDPRLRVLEALPYDLYASRVTATEAQRGA
jgi:hypothetical protein